MKAKQIKRAKSHRKIRTRMMGTALRPRLCVFKSDSHTYAQLIDDDAKKVLVAVSDIKIVKGKKAEKALEVGRAIASQALAKKIESVVFDRGGFVFHGRVKAVADGAREGGLKF